MKLPIMPGSSSSIAVFLLCLLPAGTRGQQPGRYCNGNFIDGDGALAIPGGWTSVPDYAFEYCTSLASVSFSNSSVTSVGASAFNGCSALESVVFGNSDSNSRGHMSQLMIVGHKAFIGCNALATVLYGFNYRLTSPRNINVSPYAFPSSGCSSHSNFDRSSFPPPGACKCVPFTPANRSAACVLEFGISRTSDRVPQTWRDGTAAARSRFTVGHTESVPGFDPGHTDTTLADLFENARPGVDGTDLVTFTVESNYAAGDPNFGSRSGVSLGDTLFVSPSTGTMSLIMDDPGNHTVSLIARTGAGPAEHTAPVVVLSWTVRVELPGTFGLRQDGPGGCGEQYMAELQGLITEVLRERAPRDDRHDVDTTVVLPGINTKRPAATSRTSSSTRPPTTPASRRPRSECWSRTGTPTPPPISATSRSTPTRAGRCSP